MSIFKLFHKDFHTEDAYQKYLAMPFFSRQLIFHPVRSLFCLFLIGAGSIKGYVEHVEPVVMQSAAAVENIRSSHLIIEGNFVNIDGQHIDVTPVAEFQFKKLGDDAEILNGDTIIEEAEANPVAHCEGSGFTVGQKSETAWDIEAGAPFHVARYYFFAREYIGQKDKWASMYQYDRATGCVTLLNVDYKNAGKAYWGMQKGKIYYIDSHHYRISSYKKAGYDSSEFEEETLMTRKNNQDNRFK